MISFKRTMMVSVGVAAVATFATAGQALAVSPTFSCEVQGTADTSPAVLLQGGSATYTFDEYVGSGVALNSNCVATDGNGVSVDRLAWISSGSYTNQVCGTGYATSADSQNTVATSHQSGTEDLSSAYPLDDFGYSIFFTAGQGTFSFTNPAITGQGLVSITPQFDANQTTGQCTTHFSVVGAIEGTVNADPT